MNEKANITIRKEKKDTEDYSYRKYFNREKDAILLPIVSRDVGILAGNNIIEKKGNLIGKRQIYVSSIPIKPKPFGNLKRNNSKQKEKYKNYFKEHFKKKGEELEKLKKEENLLVYLCFYLRERKFLKTDVDNYVKVIIDALSDFIGDDNKIVSLIVEKKGLINIDPKDADFFEQTLIFVSTPDAKEDLFKTPKYCFDFLGMFNKVDEVKLKGKLKINKNETNTKK